MLRVVVRQTTIKGFFRKLVTPSRGELQQYKNYLKYNLENPFETLDNATAPFGAGAFFGSIASKGGKLTSILGKLFSAEKGADEVGAFSRLVDGGGLAAHEVAGGHTLARHVGQTEVQLAGRLSTDIRISGASSFYNRGVAEEAISSALNAKQADIGAWLSGNAGRLRIDYGLNNPVGISAMSGGSANDVNSLRLILQRDSSMFTGYKIIT